MNGDDVRHDWIGSRLTYANVMATVAVFLALGGGAYALTGVPDRGGVFHGCVSSRTGLLRVVANAPSCHKAKGRGKHRDPGELTVSWNQQGPKGLQGTTGTPGTPGTPGAPGAALGWAHVLGDGTVDSGHNVASANVTHPFTLGYCFTGMGFVPHAAIASLDGINFGAASHDAAEVKIGDVFSAGQCPTGVQVEVYELIASSTPEPFSIVFE
jgi:hypothetical protein